MAKFRFAMSVYVSHADGTESLTVANDKTLALAAGPIDWPSRPRRYDTRPATKGADAEVPLAVIVAVFEVCQVEMISPPGAQMSTADP